MSVSGALKLEDELNELEKEREKLFAQINKKKIEIAHNEELAGRALLSRECYEELSSIYAEFTEEIKRKVGDEASSLLGQLLDRISRNNLHKIQVDDDFSLQIMDRWNRPFLANISAGQRQVMSISFIAALAMTASKDNRFQMPLFMDTPFGRLDKEHRSNIIKTIPKLARQWILLATNTEFRKQEARLLYNDGYWGKFYHLKAQDDGSTKIHEYDIDDAFSFLSNLEE